MSIDLTHHIFSWGIHKPLGQKRFPICLQFACYQLFFMKSKMLRDFKKSSVCFMMYFWKIFVKIANL